jgi:putative ABC transport system permease protein
VRAALGAGRKRIVRQLLTESLLLGGIGGAVGAATAWWAVRGLVKLLPDELPRIHAIEVDGWVLCFTLLLSVLVSLLFGLAPAIQATSANLVDGLKEGARGNSDGSGRRLRGALIVSEVALAVVLLAGAGLLVRSFLELQNVSPGFRVRGILTASVALPQSQYTKPDQWARFSAQAVERIKTVPEVAGAAVGMGLPMSGDRINLGFGIDGRPQAPEDHLSANYASVSRGYFQLLGIPLLRGRIFDDRDTAASKKISIVSEAFARRYFPDEEVIGKHLNFGFPDRASREIVGIVGDVRQVRLDAPAEPEMYAPFEQSPLWGMNFVVRTAGDPAALASAVRERIQEGDKDLPVADVQPMTVYLRESMAQPRFRTLLLGLFGVVALLLAAVGIYGVVSYTVAQRTQEIGLRMALGAEPAEVLGLVVGQGMKLVLVGLAAGLLGALGLTRFFSSLLFGITAGDPLIYFGTVFLLLILSLLACYLPARRATRVDPLVALRYE